jgi:hypothetical protein
MKIRREVIEQMMGDVALNAKIQIVMGVSSSSVYRWIRKNNVMLTTSDVVRVICEHFKITQDDLFEPVKHIQV